MSFTFRRLRGLSGIVKASQVASTGAKTIKVRIGRSSTIVGRRVSIIANSKTLFYKCRPHTRAATPARRINALQE
jgi:hypothetical protein